MSEITREELQAFTDSNNKVATNLEKIAERLTDITTKQDKLIEKLTNGVSTAIVTGVTSNYNATHKETISSLNRLEKGYTDLPDALEEKLNNSTIARDIEHVKWFVAIAGVVIIVAVVILRVLESQDTMKKLEAIYQHSIVTITSPALK